MRELGVCYIQWYDYEECPLQEWDRILMGLPCCRKVAAPAIQTADSCSCAATMYDIYRADGVDDPQEMERN